jgi:hypothetical protein
LSVTPTTEQSATKTVVAGSVVGTSATVVPSAVVGASGTVVAGAVTVVASAVVVGGFLSPAGNLSLPRSEAASGSESHDSNRMEPL